MTDTSAGGLRVSADRVEVWTTRHEAPEVQALMPRYETLLSADERARAARFQQAADRDRFIVGRALTRTMLASAFPLAPAAWPIAIDAHGRPLLGTRPPGAPDLRFNLSHTDGLVACAITLGREVGVDVESVDRRLTHEGIPERFFSPEEVADLRALPEAAQDVVFFDYWTLKESYIKARGLGLALPLGQFTFRLRPPSPPSIEFAPPLDDDPATWQFAQYWPTPRHRMAVAVRRTGADLPIEVSAVVPLEPA